MQSVLISHSTDASNLKEKTSTVTKQIGFTASNPNQSVHLILLHKILDLGKRYGEENSLMKRECHFYSLFFC